MCILSVFNPHAPCYRSSTLANLKCYRKNKLEKKRVYYDECVREIEWGSSPWATGFLGHGRYNGHCCNCRVQEASLSPSRETRKTIQFDTALVKVQTELFFVEISHNVHSGLTICLLSRLYTSILLFPQKISW